jgi:hypothetical protein
MRDTILGVGMILLFAGIMVLPMSLQATRSDENHLVAGREDLVFPDWSVSGQLNQSEELLVYFSRPATENIPEPTGERYMFVDIVDPHGGNTTFNITFTKTSYEVRLHTNDGGLEVDLPPGPSTADIGGRTQHSGEYTVRVYTWPALVQYYYPDSATMRRLQIFKVVERIDYLNIWALPVAVSLAAIGSIAIILGARSQKRRARRRKLRQE